MSVNQFNLCNKTQKFWKSDNIIKFITWHRSLANHVANTVIIKNLVLRSFLIWAVHASLITLNDINSTIFTSTTCYNRSRIQSKMAQRGRIRSDAIRINQGLLWHVISSLSAAFKKLQIIFGGEYFIDSPTRAVL